jgi:hypothetical protein
MTAPSGQRLPRRMAVPPSGWIGLSGRADDVWVVDDLGAAMFSPRVLPVMVGIGVEQVAHAVEQGGRPPARKTPP